MKYPAYPQYKDSGVTWLGEVPEEWNISPLKHSATIKTGYAFNSDDFIDEGIPVLRIGEITKEGNIDFSNAKCLPVEYGILYRKVLVQKDDIVMAMTGATIGKAGRYSFETPGLLNQRVCLFRPVANSDQNFLWYTLNTRFYAEYIALTAFGGAQPNISDSSLLACVVPLPPSTEQTAIADFLDRETGRIDTLVVKKRKLVELLKEKRSALISRTVTRGLPADAAREFGLTTGDTPVREAPGTYDRRGDFNRPQAEANKFAPTDENGTHRTFKDSGVEWLGEIPANWETPPLYSRYSIELGKMLNESRITGRHLLSYLRNVDVQWDSINFIDLPEMDIPEQEYSRYTVQEGDLLVCEGGEVGRSAIVGELQAKIGFQKALHRMRVLNSLMEFPRYMYYVLHWGNKTGVFNSGGISTIAHLTGEQLRKYRFPKPPFEEQAAIAAYLDRETAKIDRLVAIVETAMARLQEYRSALITAAVTGKIDVREVP